jgi:hypothetical protein
VGCLIHARVLWNAARGQAHGGDRVSVRQCAAVAGWLLLIRMPLERGEHGGSDGGCLVFWRCVLTEL